MADYKQNGDDLMNLSVADIRGLQVYLFETYGVEMIINTPARDMSQYPPPCGAAYAINPNLVKVAEQILYTTTDMIEAFRTGQHNRGNPEEWLKTYKSQVHYVTMAETFKNTES